MREPAVSQIFAVHVRVSAPDAVRTGCGCGGPAPSCSCSWGVSRLIQTVRATARKRSATMAERPTGTPPKKLTRHPKVRPDVTANLVVAVTLRDNTC